MIKGAICHQLHLQNRIQLVPNPGLEIHDNPRAKVKVTPKLNIDRVSSA